MDSAADFDFLDQRELRANRSQNFNKQPWNEEGFVKKVITSHIRQPDLLDRIKSQLPDDRCGSGWDDNIQYSLKKKNRWALLEDLRSDIEAWNDYKIDEEDNVARKPIVAAVERRSGWHQRSRRAPSCLGFHAVEMEDDELVPVHRYPAHAFGNESTLTQKPKPAKPKKTKVYRSKNDRRRIVPVEEVEEPEPHLVDGPTPRLQYEFTTFQDQDQLRKLHFATRKEDARKGRHRGHRRRGHGVKFLSEMDCLDEDLEFSESEEEVEVEAPKKDTVEESSTESIDLLLDAVEAEAVVTSSGPMAVSLADLAFLECIRTEARLEKRRQRQNRRRCHTESSVSTYRPEDDVAGPSGVTRTRTVSESEATSTNAAAPKMVVDDYFQMIPTEVLCTSESIEEAALKRAYGEAYYECSCIPRRFVIDISAVVKDLFQSQYGVGCADLDVRMLCVCEVIPPTVLVAMLDEDERLATVPMKVWINGSFARGVRSVYVDTINPCVSQTLEQIVACAVKMAGTLPLENFHKLPTSYSVDKVAQAAGRLLVKPSTKCLESSKATTEILEQENMLKKVQRQITAVARYDWYSNVGESLCGICLDWPVDEIGFCLSECRHWFCTKCWRSYCTDRILNGFGSLTCPYPKCNSSIDYYTLTTFVSLPVCQVYSEQLRDQCIRKSSNQWIWCPNGKCGRLIQRTEDSPIPALICVCGSFWCTECSSASHWPASCEHAKQYIKKLKERQDDPTLLENGATLEKRIHAVEVKKCPHCKILMEKGPGCICMSCNCGNMFCWACGQKWESTNHGSCYAIKVVQGFQRVRLVDVNQSNSEIQEIFYERSLGHRLARRTANVHKLRQDMFTKCWNAPRRVQKLALASVEDSPNSSKQFSEQRLRRRMSAVSGHVQRFLEIHHQAHYLLEFIYVHLQYCNRRSWAHLEGLKWSVDRLEFALERMEEACKAGDLKKVDEFMERVKAMLQTLVKQMWVVKLGTAQNDPRGH